MEIAGAAIVDHGIRSLTATVTFALAFTDAKNSPESAPRARIRVPSESVTCMFLTFAQVLPGFQTESELSFPQVTALGVPWRDAESVRVE